MYYCVDIVADVVITVFIIILCIRPKTTDTTLACLMQGGVGILVQI